MTDMTNRVITYERVSSEDQRERETIQTQTEELARRLQLEPGVKLVDRYVDDGVSGTIPMGERPAGRRLMADAATGRFDEVWVYRIDRLGRDDVDPLIVWRELERLGVIVRSITEGVSSPFEYHIRVAMAAEERRAFMQRSAAGMERAVRAGRFPGGIIPFGYALEGERHSARLVLDPRVIWAGLTAGDVVVKIFNRSYEGWSDVRIAAELNVLQVPTSYGLAARAVRKKATQGIWRPGRVAQLLQNTTYYGEYRYGKRPNRAGRPIISVAVPALVSRDLWAAVQQSRRTRRRKPASECKVYLLRSLVKCAICGLNYTGSVHHGDVWYRCNGQLVARGPHAGRCPSKSVKGQALESIIMDDIERWLLNPGDIIDELARGYDQERNATAAAEEAERIILSRRLDELQAKRDRLLDLYLDAQFDRGELGQRQKRLDRECAEVQTRLDGMNPPTVPDAAPIADDLLHELRHRVSAGLSDAQWHEVVTLLVSKIEIQTTPLEGGKKAAKAIVHYRFDCVVSPSTGTGS
jgi:site-specific DNA recombinase